jgi:hypothetical protein
MWGSLLQEAHSQPITRLHPQETIGSQLPHPRTTVRSPRKPNHCLSLTSDQYNILTPRLCGLMVRRALNWLFPCPIYPQETRYRLIPCRHLSPSLSCVLSLSQRYAIVEGDAPCRGCGRLVLLPPPPPPSASASAAASAVRR